MHIVFNSLFTNFYKFKATWLLGNMFVIVGPFNYQDLTLGNIIETGTHF